MADRGPTAFDISSLAGGMAQPLDVDDAVAWMSVAQVGQVRDEKSRISL